MDDASNFSQEIFIDFSVAAFLYFFETFSRFFVTKFLSQF